MIGKTSTYLNWIFDIYPETKNLKQIEEKIETTKHNIFIVWSWTTGEETVKNGLTYSDY